MEEHPTHLVIDENVSIPLEEFRFSYVRSSGPGGQNVNKVNSQAQLSWRVGECTALSPEVLERLKLAQKGRISRAGLLRVDSQRYRDRERNRQDCLERVRGMVTAALTPPTVRKKTKVPRGVNQNRLRNKQHRSQTKQSRQSPRHDD